MNVPMKAMCDSSLLIYQMRQNLVLSSQIKSMFRMR